MAEKPRAISQDTAEAYALLGIPYEGYVEGIGYQSLLAQTLGSCYFQERGCAIPAFQAFIDTSPEEYIKSMNVSSDDLIDRLVQFQENGSTLVNMGHGNFREISGDVEIVARIEDGISFTFGFREQTTGKEEIIKGKLTDYEIIFGDSFAMGRIYKQGEIPMSVINTIAGTSSFLGYFENAYRVTSGHEVKYAQRIYGKGRHPDVINRHNRMRSLSTARSLSRVGYGLYLLSAGITVYDAVNYGEWTTRHSADIFVTGTLLTLTVCVPVVGWIAGGLYFALDAACQYNTGESLTQYFYGQERIRGSQPFNPSSLMENYSCEPDKTRVDLQHIYFLKN